MLIASRSLAVKHRVFCTGVVGSDPELELRERLSLDDTERMETVSEETTPFWRYLPDTCPLAWTNCPKRTS